MKERIKASLILFCLILTMVFFMTSCGSSKTIYKTVEGNQLVTEHKKVAYHEVKVSVRNDRNVIRNYIYYSKHPIKVKYKKYK